MTVGVPAYRRSVFSPRRHPYVVCIPVLNEDGRLTAFLARLKPFQALIDVVIADGGSTDGSVDEARLQAAGVRALLIKEGPGRLSAQLRMGLSWTLEEGYEGVIVVDGNNKDDPAALPLFIEGLKNGLGHIQGSRYVPGGQAINTPFLRHWGVRLLHAPLIRWASGFPYTDTTNGFRAYSKKFLEHPGVQPFRDVFVGYELHYYLAIRAARLGLGVKEVPVTRAYPVAGKTPTKISGWRGNWAVLKTLLQTVRGDFDPRH